MRKKNGRENDHIKKERKKKWVQRMRIENEGRKKKKTLSRTHTDYRNVYVRISASVKQQKKKSATTLEKKKHTI